MPRPCQAKIVNVNGSFRNGLSKCFESLILERLSISPRGSWRSNKLFASSIRVFSFDENVVQFEVLRRELGPKQNCGLYHYYSENIRNRGVAQRNPKLFHARRTRSRSAVTSPFLRISLIETSIFGPFAAASNSCSRLAIRRSLSWRINSRMYSLGVPQSPDATWPST